MNQTRTTRLAATAFTSLALAGFAISPALAATGTPMSTKGVPTAQSNSVFQYSDNWLVNDSGRTVHVKAQVDVAYSLESNVPSATRENVESKTVEKDLQPGESLRMAGGSGGDSLFEYHLFVSYSDGSAADVAMYNPYWGQPWTRDGHASDDKHHIEEGGSHTNDVGNGHTIEVNRHWNHTAGEDDGDRYFNWIQGIGPITICNWDYHIR